MYLFGKITVKPQLPERISYLSDIANNLWWSWNTTALRLYDYIDPILFAKVGKNPVKFLSRINQKRLIEVANDNDFLKDYDLIVDNSFLEKIENKTEAFSPSKIMKIDFACVIFNNDIALALKMNKEGKVIGRSKLLFEESDDLVFSGMDLKEECIESKVNSKKEKANELKKALKSIISLFSEENEKENEEAKEVEKLKARELKEILKGIFRIKRHTKEKNNEEDII